MDSLVFATNNNNKIIEIKKILPPKYKILSLDDINCNVDIPENQDTIEKNSIQKAQFIYDKYKLNCFADDTGLETEALNNEPGVFSARYAGENKDFEANIDKLLEKLEGITNRKARFLTVISLFYNGQLYLFKGIVNGQILNHRRGTGGFGYDSVFQPEGYIKTFAEMTTNEKNSISHRGIAVNSLIKFLESVK